MPARTPQPASSERAAPRLRRAYYDCRYGQLHLHNAIPGGGGFDELTSLICLHDAGESGRVYAPLLGPLGLARSVYALDLPGSGESDPAPGVDALAAAVHAVTDFVESMRIRQFDLIARGESCAAARRLAETRSGVVRRMVLVGDPAARPAAGLEALTLASGADQDPGFSARVLSHLT
jgi:pimeloyl-ACP methyl ester carboxylesterase